VKVKFKRQYKKAKVNIKLKELQELKTQELKSNENINTKK